MLNPTHILNGDALKEQFPSSIPGELIIFRECLSDGKVNAKTEEEFYRMRSEFISSNYEGYNEKDYFEHAVPELEKLKSISNDNSLHLWFEKDLFCQVNFWYTIHTLLESDFSNSMFLVLPNTDIEFGFGGMVESDLVVAFTERQEISVDNQKLFQQLWKNYRSGKRQNMASVSEKLKKEYPFVSDTVQACLAGMETPGRPKDSLKQIMDDLGTDDFGQVFREFSKRESIYGFGDLQVKRLLDELKN